MVVILNRAYSLRAGNPCHKPAGSPQGGQFCETDGGAGDEKPTAEKPASISGMEHLSDRERKAVENYQAEAYVKINSDLRKGKGPNADAQAIDTAIAKTRLSQDFTSYRGIGNTLSKELSDRWRDKEGNEEITYIDKAFVSTSTSQKVAESFSKNIITYKLPKGLKAMNIEDFENKNEREVLLPRGLKFKVNNVRKTAAGWRRFDVEVMQ